MTAKQVFVEVILQEMIQDGSANMNLLDGLKELIEKNASYRGIPDVELTHDGEMAYREQLAQMPKVAKALTLERYSKMMGDKFGPSRAIYPFGVRPEHRKAIVEELFEIPQISGRTLLELLNKRGIKISAVRFYMIMSKLEAEGLVLSWDNHEVLDGHRLKLRHFKLNPDHKPISAGE